MEQIGTDWNRDWNKHKMICISLNLNLFLLLYFIIVPMFQSNYEKSECKNRNNKVESRKSKMLGSLELDQHFLYSVCIYKE